MTFASIINEGLVAGTVQVKFRWSLLTSLPYWGPIYHPGFFTSLPFAKRLRLIASLLHHRSHPAGHGGGEGKAAASPEPGRSVPVHEGHRKPSRPRPLRGGGRRAGKREWGQPEGQG
eukprot:scaffold130879_cov34-Prasinocladus_malaysianus.AAC.2